MSKHHVAEDDAAMALKLMNAFRKHCGGSTPTDQLANEFALVIERHHSQSAYGLKPGLKHTVIAADLMRHYRME
jgi:hypothetical protein